MSVARQWWMRRLPRAVWRASAWRGLRIVEDLAYAAHPTCRLDVLAREGLPDGAPVVLHVHGGAFRVFSKETHGYPVARYARAGFVVLNVNYRLAPAHPYPAAVEDVHAAWCWAVREVARYGGDPDRIVLSGESAGANLALGLCLSTTFDRREAWARDPFRLGRKPLAAHLAYGFLQATDTGRYLRDSRINNLVGLRLGVIERDYLDGADRGVPRDYAEPLRVLESAPPAALRDLPEVLALCGTWDVIADDTRRLVTTLQRAGAPVESVWVDGAVHGFHTLPGPRSETAWRALLDHARAVTG